MIYETGCQAFPGAALSATLATAKPPQEEVFPLSSLGTKSRKRFLFSPPFLPAGTLVIRTLFPFPPLSFLQVLLFFFTVGDKRSLSP